MPMEFKSYSELREFGNDLRSNHLSGGSVMPAGYGLHKLLDEPIYELADLPQMDLNMRTLAGGLYIPTARAIPHGLFGRRPRPDRNAYNKFITQYIPEAVLNVLAKYRLIIAGGFAAAAADVACSAGNVCWTALAHKASDIDLYMSAETSQEIKEIIDELAEALAQPVRIFRTSCSINITSPSLALPLQFVLATTEGVSELLYVFDLPVASFAIDLGAKGMPLFSTHEAIYEKVYGAIIFNKKKVSYNYEHRLLRYGGPMKAIVVKNFKPHKCHMKNHGVGKILRTGPTRDSKDKERGYLPDDVVSDGNDLVGKYIRQTLGKSTAVLISGTSVDVIAGRNSDTFVDELCAKYEQLLRELNQTLYKLSAYDGKKKFPTTEEMRIKWSKQIDALEFGTMPELINKAISWSSHEQLHNWLGYAD